jgi:hypothetical protein
MSGFVAKYLAFSAFQKVPALRRAVGSGEFLVESKNSNKNLHSAPSIATAMARGKALVTRAVKRIDGPCRSDISEKCAQLLSDRPGGCV